MGAKFLLEKLVFAKLAKKLPEMLLKSQVS
jgi:hypothetical protein